jgi:hypothetical protein
MLFNLVKLNEKRHRINSKLKEFENPFEHDEIVNTEKCGEKKYYIFSHFFCFTIFLVNSQIKSIFFENN